MRAYGIPEHADQLPLRTTETGGLDPYRLYNLDVAYYELDSPMALYGAVPVMYGHGTERTAGVFFLNGAEQWIEVNNSASQGVEAYFMAESGAFDVFVFLGPRPADTVKQYANLTGVAPLPQVMHVQSCSSHTFCYNYIHTALSHKINFSLFYIIDLFIIILIFNINISLLRSI